ncbi:MULTISPECIES: entericidin A/B family lipoprotein [Euryhalocaulis]|nr:MULTISPECIES: entericidin A/B family lipoprotein [Euryhalocaulis]MBA4802927.1 entericidin A/B family lipoprotein [Euryhalocaulis sp.]
MKKFAIILAGLMALTLTACNTIAGAGRDVESAGDAVEDAAEGAK